MPKRGPERVAALGAAAIGLSMLFPWYGFKLGSPLSATGLDAFTFAHLALLVTAALAVGLATRWRDADFPRPLSIGTLMVVAGAWSVVLIGFLIADPPDVLADTATIGGVRIRYGAYVAAGGAAAIVFGGLGLRRQAAKST